MLKGEVLDIEICRMFGWTYHDLIAQPQWFIDTVIEKMKIDRTRPAAPMPNGEQ